MSAVIEALTVQFGDKIALDSVALQIASGERFTVMGPSGSGKSTLLRAIAGLEALTSGSIHIDGTDTTRTPTHMRPIGLMFQDYALFPHLSVKGNIAYGLRMHGVSRKHQDDTVAQLLGIAGLQGFEDRSISSLSGGERQRVALVRTLAPRPSLVMLDEPLGSLDLALRESLLEEMREIITNLGTTALSVTHDRIEAFAFADRIAIMRAGKIVRVGTPAEVWNEPLTVFVAKFLGHPNVAEGTVIGRPSSTVLIPTGAVSFTDRGGIPATVTNATFSDGRYLVAVAPRGGSELRVFSDRAIAQGTEVLVAIDEQAIQVLHDDGEAPTDGLLSRL
ncbi:MAG: ABC transporter ATP-binding protein [Actinomycetia bacterium]|nr:ABC transporter ATP-binding protein [Actinomycetes bacterium]